MEEAKIPTPVNPEVSPKVLIVGGGFGGLNAAKILSQRAGIKAGVEILMVDRRNHHLFQPLLYQVAMAALSPADIAVPIRSILSGRPNVRVVMAEVSDIDFKNRTAQIGPKSESYDFLILACGARHSYFGHDEWELDAPGLKTLEQATEIRRRVLSAYEEAEAETNVERQRELLTFVVIGGGPTGVELAGALAEISRSTLSRDFRNIDPRRTRIILIEAGPRLLAGFEPELSVRAARDLEQMGVQIWTSSRVSHVDRQGVQLGSERIRAATVLWAAGVQPSSLNKRLQSEIGATLDRTGRVVVGEDLSLSAIGHPELFVIGDQACFIDPATGRALPGLAPIAIQQGRKTAENILKTLLRKSRTPFCYLDKGQMATIGKRRAVAQVGRLKFAGLLAWIAWLFIHIYYLVGFKNRVLVLYQWAWNYMTSKRGARLIVPDFYGNACKAQKESQSFSSKSSKTSQG